MVQLAVKLFGEFHVDDASTGLAVEGLVLEMLAQVSREANKSEYPGVPKWLQTIVELIHIQNDTSLSLTQLAVVAGVHPVHLARTFRRTFGCTIGEYSRRLRLERACQLLVTRLPISQVAVTCGFYDQSHFVRVFKRGKGVTPAAYRKTFLG